MTNNENEKFGQLNINDIPAIPFYYRKCDICTYKYLELYDIKLLFNVNDSLKICDKCNKSYCNECANENNIIFTTCEDKDCGDTFCQNCSVIEECTECNKLSCNYEQIRSCDSDICERMFCLECYKKYVKDCRNWPECNLKYCLECSDISETICYTCESGFCIECQFMQHCGNCDISYCIPCSYNDTFHTECNRVYCDICKEDENLKYCNFCEDAFCDCEACNDNSIVCDICNVLLCTNDTCDMLADIMILYYKCECIICNECFEHSRINHSKGDKLSKIYSDICTEHSSQQFIYDTLKYLPNNINKKLPIELIDIIMELIKN